MKLAKITASGPAKNVRNTQPVIYQKGYSPFIQGGTWWQYDEGVKGYIDTGIPVQGPTGEQGPMGEQGIKGDTGETGPAGPKGDVGAIGPKGDKGDKGDAGAAGNIGPQGPRGEKGMLEKRVMLERLVHRVNLGKLAPKEKQASLEKMV